MLFHYSTVSGVLLACYIKFAFATSISTGEVVFQCAPIASKTCLVTVRLENSADLLSLHGAENKNTLNIKGGSIGALKMTHCNSAFKSFDKITIGEVGLQELCILPNFVSVEAKNNRIRTLHVEESATPYRVEKLNLNDNLLETVESMRTFVALKELHLERNALSTLDMACFANMVQLEKLYLGSNRLNTIFSSVSDLSLPQLTFLDLQNNTLTELNLQTWSLPVLEQLELHTNNLTIVSGLERLEALSDISLANNQLQCDELDQMLERLNTSGVTIKDGDQNCSGIRGSNICCKYVEPPTAQTLLNELNKFNTLKERYDELEKKWNETVKNTVKQFGEKIEQLKQTCQKKNEVTEVIAPSTNTDTDEGNTEVSTGGPEVKAPVCECTCSEARMKAVDEKLNDLEKKISDSNVLLKGLKDDQTQFSYMTVLAKHEFRTAVKRGEHKLKELSSMLAMLREHVQEKKQQSLG